MPTIVTCLHRYIYTNVRLWLAFVITITICLRPAARLARVTAHTGHYLLCCQPCCRIFVALRFKNP